MGLYRDYIKLKKEEEDRDLKMLQDRNRLERANENDLVRQLLVSGQLNVDPGEYQYSPEGFSRDGSNEPVKFSTKIKKGKKAYFSKNADGKLVQIQVPEGYDEIGVVDLTDNQPADKETPQEKAAREVMQQVAKYQADFPDAPLPPALKKQADAVAPVLNMEAVETRGKRKKNFFGKYTGERLQGDTIYKPKGTIAEVEWDQMAEDELTKAFQAQGLEDKEIMDYLTPENIAEAKRQLKAKKAAAAKASKK